MFEISNSPFNSTGNNQKIKNENISKKENKINILPNNSILLRTIIKVQES